LRLTPAKLLLGLAFLLITFPTLAEDVWTEPNTGMKFRRIPGGSFLMGSPTTEEGRDYDETQHTVSVGEFWLGETEVAQAQWQAVLGSNPSTFRGSDRPVEQVSWRGILGFIKKLNFQGRRRLTRPVERVSWDDIQEFIKKLNARSGKRFRLPTEAEWEYAARAGTTTAYYWGDEIGSNNANCLKCGSRWDNKEPAPVRSFKPNAFGLFGMLGNVEEWTCSEYKKSYDGSEQECSVSASKHSIRGGSWLHFPWWVRAASRDDGFFPDGRAGNFGFRLAQD
jgi:formylglycine-generating enzyme required for sulfatase activity